VRFSSSGADITRRAIAQDRRKKKLLKMGLAFSEISVIKAGPK